MRRRVGRAPVALLALVGVLLLAPDVALSQADLDRRIRDNQLRLDSIRREREALQDELENLRGRARDITSEIRNIEQQKNLTSRVL